MTFTPDVPDVKNPGFLSSVVGNNVSYRIVVLNQLDSNHLVVDLSGPGPDYRCRDVITAMGRDARVQSIRVLPQTAP